MLSHSSVASASTESAKDEFFHPHFGVRIDRLAAIPLRRVRLVLYDNIPELSHWSDINLFNDSGWGAMRAVCSYKGCTNIGGPRSNSALCLGLFACEMHGTDAKLLFEKIYSALGYCNKDQHSAEMEQLRAKVFADLGCADDNKEP